MHFVAEKRTCMYFYQIYTYINFHKNKNLQATKYIQKPAQKFLDILHEMPEAIVVNTVIPGDQIPNVISDKIKLGPGLMQEGDSIIAIKAGKLMHTKVGNQWWVDSNQKRYVPAQNESVIGTVTMKTVDYYKLDIGSAHQALLHVLAFEGAQKRNKPNIPVGALVYARVSVANKDMEPELECFNATTGKADGFGELKGGFLIKCSLGLCRRLFNPNTPILTLLGERFSFEMAVGMNGRVWIDSGSTSLTFKIGNAIQNSEYLSEQQCKNMVKQLSDE